MDRAIPLARCDRAARRREQPSPRRDCRRASILPIAPATPTSMSPHLTASTGTPGAEGPRSHGHSRVRVYRLAPRTQHRPGVLAGQVRSLGRFHVEAPEARVILRPRISPRAAPRNGRQPGDHAGCTCWWTVSVVVGRPVVRSVCRTASAQARHEPERRRRTPTADRWCPDGRLLGALPAGGGPHPRP